jgi:hypothetical protein
VNNVLLSVNGGNLALLLLEGASENDNLIILSDGKGTDLDSKCV